MPLEPMSTHQVVSLRLNLDNALASSLEGQFSSAQHVWILSRLESSWSVNLQTTMVTHITWLLRTATISVMIYVISWLENRYQNGSIDSQRYVYDDKCLSPCYFSEVWVSLIIPFSLSLEHLRTKWSINWPQRMFQWKVF